MADETHDRPFAIVGSGTLFDGGRVLGDADRRLPDGRRADVLLRQGELFDDDGNAPPGIKEQFKETFIRHVPGTDAAWVILGILEFGVFLLLVASLVLLEFLPHRDKPSSSSGSRSRC